MKRFQRGLIVGKFSPLHRGHEYLINTALSECDEIIVVAYNNPEFPGCEPEKKRRWFSTLFPLVRAIVLDDANVLRHLGANSRFRTIPVESEPADTHRTFVTEVYCHCVGLPLDVIFTSESYGPGFVAAVNEYFRTNTTLAPKVVHREVDRARTVVPISASRARNDPHGLRRFLSPEVYRDFVRTIVFFGGESTGKTTIAELAARRFGTVWVAEYGRELWVEKSGKLEPNDYALIARRHTAREEQGLLEASRFLFVDTSPLTTLFYSRALTGDAPPELEHWAERRYDYAFLCMPDIPFVQDSTRADEAFRMRQHEWYLRELAERGVNFTMLAGNIEQRMRTLREKLEALFPGLPCS